MSHTQTLEKPTLAFDGIAAINSLGGPPLSIERTDIAAIKVTLENQASLGIQRWQVNVAGMIPRR